MLAIWICQRGAHKVPPEREKVKVLDLIRKEIKTVCWDC